MVFVDFTGRPLFLVFTRGRHKISGETRTATARHRAQLSSSSNTQMAKPFHQSTTQHIRRIGFVEIQTSGKHLAINFSSHCDTEDHQLQHEDRLQIPCLGDQIYIHFINVEQNPEKCAPRSLWPPFLSRRTCIILRKAPGAHAFYSIRSPFSQNILI